MEKKNRDSGKESMFRSSRSDLPSTLSRLSGPIISSFAVWAPAYVRVLLRLVELNELPQQRPPHGLVPTPPPPPPHPPPTALDKECQASSPRAFAPCGTPDDGGSKIVQRLWHLVRLQVEAGVHEGDLLRLLPQHCPIAPEHATEVILLVLHPPCLSVRLRGVAVGQHHGRVGARVLLGGVAVLVSDFPPEGMAGLRGVLAKKAAKRGSGDGGDTGRNHRYSLSGTALRALPEPLCIPNGPVGRWAEVLVPKYLYWHHTSKALGFVICAEIHCNLLFVIGLHLLLSDS